VITTINAETAEHAGKRFCGFREFRVERLHASGALVGDDADDELDDGGQPKADIDLRPFEHQHCDPPLLLRQATEVPRGA
jgi:hypothetical protein